MIQGFKDFLLRGNIVDLAVAVVIGTAFTALVTAFTQSFINPLIGLVGGGGKTGGTFGIDGQVFTYGVFITAAITFVLTAAVVYFLVVVPLTRVNERRARGAEDEPAGPSEDVALLREIRDALRQRG
ncbi:mechanosensitive ion channel protein MscL [Aeromicrobium sp. Root495]|uniref:large conductance mechanosensitive channel protein MscL n=1 Tax=Aeromicrobium sp. Root495 TaxID=1736550 RepID=UPI0006FA745F|nr:large conductance mechanosensitive channel protein MscL [Aeromicrobium sp. Root495]KQY60811.1 mechanosensitive ion channel protein MscL [Aeromicrobium sp. Root495]